MAQDFALTSTLGMLPFSLSSHEEGSVLLIATTLCLAPFGVLVAPKHAAAPSCFSHILEGFDTLPALLLSPCPELYSGSSPQGRQRPAHPMLGPLQDTPSPARPPARTLNSQGRNSPGQAPIILPTAICHFIQY